MGTSSKGGLICNDMTSIDGAVKSQRMTQTIEKADKIPTTFPDNVNSSELAKYAGYYPLPSLSEGAFLSI